MREIDDLDILPAPPMRITVDGRVLEIGALRLRQWPPMADVLKDGWADILSGDATKILARRRDVYEAIIVGVGGEITHEWLESLYPSQVLRIFKLLVEANRDFFDLKVLPEMKALMAAFAPAGFGEKAASAALSPGLPSADTGSTTS